MIRHLHSFFFPYIFFPNKTDIRTTVTFFYKVFPLKKEKADGQFTSLFSQHELQTAMAVTLLIAVFVNSLTSHPKAEIWLLYMW